MDRTFGAAFFHNLNLRERPDVAIGALATLREQGGEARAVFQGMFAATDKWSRRLKITDRSLAQLAVDLRGGVYSDLAAFLGERGVEIWTLSFDCGREGATGRYPSMATLTVNLSERTALSDAERVAARLWELFRPAYGFSVIGATPHDVGAELTGIPHKVWGVPSDPAEERRLLLLQDLRPLFGECTRGSAWSHYLGADLVKRLGGAKRVECDAPAVAVEQLSDGGIYLRVADESALLGTQEYETAVAPVRHFLNPVIPEALKGTGTRPDTP